MALSCLSFSLTAFGCGASSLLVLLPALLELAVANVDAFADDFSFKASVSHRVPFFSLLSLLSLLFQDDPLGWALS